MAGGFDGYFGTGGPPACQHPRLVQAVEQFEPGPNRQFPGIAPATSAATQNPPDGRLAGSGRDQHREDTQGQQQPRQRI
jgi:hypothetical protein